MGAQTSASTSVHWEATGATQIAVATGKLGNAFDAPNSKKYAADASPQNVGPFSCSGESTVYSTVTARGPGGDATVLVTWTIHHM